MIKLSPKQVLWILVLYQLISVYLMATGVWPAEVAFVNLGLSAAYILFATPYFGLLFLIVSIPFFITFPNFYSDSMSTWRLLFSWLFVVWVAKEWWKVGFKQFILKTLQKFFIWDIFLALFGLVGLMSVFLARYQVQTIKQVLFFLNLYLLYVVVISIIRSREQVVEVIKYTSLSLAIIVALGYAQFAATFFMPQYYFWQYWATMVSKLYYGQSLANVLVYSNSWFSYTSEIPDLRMFSIMPDSHSFAVVALMLMTFLLPLTYFFDTKELFNRGKFKFVPNKVSNFVWTAVRFSGLAIIFSGTRGVWVGMVAPFLITIVFYAKKISRPLVSKTFWAMFMIVILFMLSPLINAGLHAVRVGSYRENFLKRAQSIYDLGEESNAARIKIWKESLIYFTQHPAGVGFGNFVVSLVPPTEKNLSFEEASSLKNYRYNLPRKFVTAHSLYLNVLVELGVLGIGVAALAVLAYFKKIWEFIKTFGEEKNIFTLFVLNAGLMFLWIFAYSVFDVTLFNDRVMMYSLIALGLSGVIMRKYKDL